MAGLSIVNPPCASLFAEPISAMLAVTLSSVRAMLGAGLPVVRLTTVPVIVFAKAMEAARSVVTRNRRRRDAIAFIDGSAPQLPGAQDAGAEFEIRWPLRFR